MDGETQTNEEMMEKLVAATSAKEVQDIANEYGVELTGDQAAEFLAMVKNAEAGEGKLSDDALETVTGGRNVLKEAFEWLKRKLSGN